MLSHSFTELAHRNLECTLPTPVTKALLCEWGQLGGKNVVVRVGAVIRTGRGVQGIALGWEKQQLLSFQVQAGRADERPAEAQGACAGGDGPSHRRRWRRDAGWSTASREEGEVLYYGDTPEAVRESI